MALIELAFPKISVKYDGIADFSRQVGQALEQAGHEVQLLGAASAFESTLRYSCAWPNGLHDNSEMMRRAKEHDPDVIMLQLEQFTYGTRGWNPTFSRMARDLRSTGWHGTLGLIVHETYPAADTVGHFAMKLYQRSQARRIVRDVDFVAFSCEQGFNQLGHFNRNSHVLPIPSNIPHLGGEKDLLRASYKWDQEDVVIVVFGAIGDVRLLTNAMGSIKPHERIRFVYIGKDLDRARASLPGESTEFLGPLDSIEVSNRLSAADIGLVLPPDGVSARRGSFTAMALHGLPIVASAGMHTDQFLVDAANTGLFDLTAPMAPEIARAIFALATDKARRARMRAAILSSPLARDASCYASDLLSLIK